MSKRIKSSFTVNQYQDQVRLGMDIKHRMNDDSSAAILTNDNTAADAVLSNPDMTDVP